MAVKVQEQLEKWQMEYDRIIETQANTSSREGLEAYLKAGKIKKQMSDLCTGAKAEAYKTESEEIIRKVEKAWNDLKDGQQKEKSLEELLNELDQMTGLQKVKDDVHALVEWMKNQNIRTQKGLSVVSPALHLAFTGNPGTGKTTVARLIGQIYKALGLLKKGHLIETDRSGLVGSVVGGTEKKVQKVIGEALGGVLFIDEAYTLTHGQKDGDFGRIAVDILMKAMEDHRDELVVIVAGYPDLMNEFMDSNEGMKSRVPNKIRFEDYTVDELMSIFMGICSEKQYTVNEHDKSTELLKQYCEDSFNAEDKSNARGMRNLFEMVTKAQSPRVNKRYDAEGKQLPDEQGHLMSDEEEKKFLMELRQEDFEAAMLKIKQMEI